MTSALARLAATAATAVLVGTTLAAAPSGPTWADASQATIHPGVQTVSGGQCTSNFVFTDNAGGVYLGQSAHCTSTDASTSTNGCFAGTLEVGLPVAIQGATQPGTLVYSSWNTMQEIGEDDADTCAYNDFALVKVHRDDVARVNPSIPVFGGPVALTDAVSAGTNVSSYGNSGLRFGLNQLSPKTGVSLGQGGNGWTHTVYTVTPGIPGDSGSGFLDSDGNAFGVLSTLGLTPLPASNGVTDLALALDYARAHGGMDVQLATGTEPFSGLPLVDVPLPTAPAEHSKAVDTGNLLVGNLLVGNLL